MAHGLALAAATLGLTLAACEPTPETREERLVLEPVGYRDLPGWTAAGFDGALAAFRRSCDAMAPDNRRPGGAAVGTEAIPLLADDWQAPCATAAELSRAAPDDAVVRAFFEAHFLPYRASNNGEKQGLFTGYFEAELRGARARGPGYEVPLYTLPPDHVRVDLADFDAELKGRSLVGRVEGGRLLPYHDRAAIESGALAGKAAELVWVADPLDAFLLHVQGSGRVLLPDGDVVRVGFAGHNGFGYRSIGRELIERGELDRDGASWDHIRAWLEANPVRAAEIFAVNRRYIFFRELQGEGPIGAQGVALTPRRSLAVDRRYVALGLPVWLDTVWPGDGDRPLRTLLVAQDTGNAIKGPVRGDFFWGYGKDALAYAGRMRSRGSYYLLIPKPAAARLAGQS